jgi:RHS repeat-associated protein
VAGDVAHSARTTAGGPAATGASTEHEYTGTRVRRARDLHYQHDERGRVIVRQQRRPSLPPITWHYVWDEHDRLTGLITPDGTRWRYDYDPLGRRIAKTRFDRAGSPVERIDLVWDGVLLAEEIHSAGRVRTWEMDPATCRPLTQVEQIPAADAPQADVDRRFYGIVADLVGTPTELVSAAGGVVWRRQATLWGEPVDQPTGPADTPLRFPGQYHDSESGLDYNYHRYYDPVAARYLSADPLGLLAGPAPSSYVHNPLARSDALGLVGSDGVEWVDPNLINFSQRTASPNNYAELMRSGEWDWTRPGTALRVMEVNGQLVTYDNRRLDAGRDVQEPVAIERVNPDDPFPASTTGKTWGQKFRERFNDPRNRRAGGAVPETGLPERPTIPCE